MRRNFSIFLVASAIIAVGCGRINRPHPLTRNYGDPIVFGSSMNSGTGTKAAYTDSIFDGFERITWCENDFIQIHCGEAVNGPTHDYIVKSVSTTGNISSKAQIESATGKGSGCLEWGDPGTYVFTSVCPAPGHGISGVAIPETGKVKCVLPEVQENDGVSEIIKEKKGGDFIAKADPKCIYLTGYATTDSEKESGPVQINYDPAFTAFQITLTNGFDSGNRMKINSAGIKSVSDNLSGTYTVDVTGIDGEAGTLACDDIALDAATATKEAKMTFDPPVSIAKDSSLTFTLFAQPAGDVDSLTFWFRDETGCERSFEFRYNNPEDGNPWVGFKAFHKAKIKGLIAPESSEWTIDMKPMITSWGQDNQNVDGDEGKIIKFNSATIQDWADGQSEKIKVK